MVHLAAGRGAGGAQSSPGSTNLAVDQTRLQNIVVQYAASRVKFGND
jgi:hypothetical protein